MAAGKSDGGIVVQLDVGLPVDSQAERESLELVRKGRVLLCLFTPVSSYATVPFIRRLRDVWQESELCLDMRICANGGEWWTKSQ